MEVMTMIRLTLLGLILLIVIGCSTCNGGNEMSIQDKYDQMLLTSARIETEISSGSGTAIDQYGGFTIVLTARHVIEDAEEIYVRFYSEGTDYPATVLKVSEDHDLALLMVQHRHRHAANWGEPFEALVFWEVFKVGYALGYDEPLVTEGVISAVDEYHFVTSSPVVWGDSGGGIFWFDDETDEFTLIGVTAALGVARSGGGAFPVFHIGYATDMFAAEELFQQEE